MNMRHISINGLPSCQGYYFRIFAILNDPYQLVEILLHSAISIIQAGLQKLDNSRDLIC